MSMNRAMIRTTAITIAVAAGLVLASVAAFSIGVQHGFVRALAEFDSYSAVLAEKASASTMQRVLSMLRRGDGNQAEAILTSHIVLSAAALSNALQSSRRYEYLHQECTEILRITDAIRDENLLRGLAPEAKRAYEREIGKIRNICSDGTTLQKT